MTAAERSSPPWRPRSLLVGALLQSVKMLRYAASGVSAAAFGVCDAEDLHARGLRYWEGYKQYQSKEHTFSGLFDWEEEAFGRYLPPQGRIGIIGCGTGREIVVLAKRGYEMEGVDYARHSIALGREYLTQAGIDAELHLADASNFGFPLERYDAFIISWFTYAYIVGAATRVAFLRRLRRRLATGGRVIVTVEGSPQTACSRAAGLEGMAKVTRLAARISRNPHVPTPSDRFRYDPTAGILHDRLFTRDELENEASAAGLLMLSYEGFSDQYEEASVAVLAADRGSGHDTGEEDAPVVPASSRPDEIALSRPASAADTAARPSDRADRRGGLPKGFRRLVTDGLVLAAKFLIQVSKGLGATAFGASDHPEVRRRAHRYWNHVSDIRAEAKVPLGLMDWEEQAYGRYLPPHGSIGIIGCGAGRDLIALAQRGYQVEGVDISPRSIERGRELLAKTGIDATLRCGDVTSSDFPGDQYDVFLFSWFTYAYIPGVGSRIELLDRLRGKLAPGGRIILTLPQRQGYEENGPALRLARWAAKITRNPNPPEPRIRFGVQHESGAFSYERLFDRGEIVAEAGAARLDVLHWDTFGSPGSRERQIVAVLCPPPSDTSGASIRA